MLNYTHTLEERLLKNIQNEFFYFPLQAMMTLLKPTKTPLLGLLNRRKTNDSLYFQTQDRGFYH